MFSNYLLLCCFKNYTYEYFNHKFLSFLSYLYPHGFHTFTQSSITTSLWVNTSVFIIHWDSIWEALGGAVTFPGASPTPPPAVQRSWPWGLEAWASPLSGWGLRSWEREGFHQEEFGRGASSSPCSSQNNTGQPHQIRPGLGDWGVLKKDRGSRERAREMFSWEISHSLFTLSVLWFESAK